MASCYGLVLAGGLSSRMGQDKAQLCRDGQTLLQYSQSLLASLGLEVLVSGGEQGIPDLLPQQGPLAGIYSVIRHCRAEHQRSGALLPGALLIVPVDMPLLTPQLLQQLLTVGESSATASCFQDCYLPLYLPVNDVVTEYLEQLFHGEDLEREKPIGAGRKSAGKRPLSIKKMLATVGVTQLPVVDPQALANVNTEEEWRLTKRLIESK